MKVFFLLACLTVSQLAIGSKIHPNRMLVKAADSKSIQNLKHKTQYKHLFKSWFVVYSNDLNSLKQELTTNEGIISYENDHRAKGKKLPETHYSEPENLSYKSNFNDPLVGKVWSFKDSSRNGVSVNKAYESGFPIPTKKIIVAIVDTGIDYNHEDLRGVMWTNAGEIPGNGLDDDNNGYIDDIHGINTVQRDSENNATGEMMDTHSHGSHVAGTIGAQQNNGIGISGIASHVELMGIRTVPNSGDELDVDVVESFLYAAKNGARIINCSFGKDKNEGGQAVKEVIDFIGSRYGTLVIAAAGNSSRNIDTRLTYPASFSNPNLLVVASTTSSGRLSYFSNYGAKNVDLAAPGSNIFSTVPGNRYGSKSGTSMASPTTAGVAAEVLSRHPSLTPEQLKDLLMKSVTKSRRIRRAINTQGRVDLYNALNMVN
jgi:thermitase